MRPHAVLVPGSSPQNIISVRPVERVNATPSPSHIRAVVCFQDVSASTTEKPVTAVPPINLIVAPAANKTIASHAADQNVASIATADQITAS